MGYDSKGILVFNLKYEHVISFINLVKFINYYQMPRSISSKLFVIASGEANVYGSSYYWNFRTSFFKQVACLILVISTQMTLKEKCISSVLMRFLCKTSHKDSCAWPCLTWHYQPIKSAEYNQWSPLLRLL